MTKQGLRGQMIWRDKSTVTEIPADGAYVQIVRDNWWAVNELGQVAFYEGTYPQCNANRLIAERVGGGVGVECIPIVFLPLDINDY